MHIAPEALQAGRLAALEGAVLALMRSAVEDGFDGITIEVKADEGQTFIDLTFSSKGVGVTGQDL